MMKAILTILVLIMTISLTFSQSDCQRAIERAEKDFNNSNFAFHSGEFLISEKNSFLYVLREFFKINWYFTDSLSYYNCYDSIMTVNLKKKFGDNFLIKAQFLADSLDSSKYWTKDAMFPGGEDSLFKFIEYKLLDLKINLDSIKSRMYIEIEIDSTGKVKNPIIRRGINNEIDKKVLLIFTQMPDWEPAYLLGKPIRQFWNIPITVDKLK